MIHRIAVHIRKEILLLLRDRAGLALLYLMPAALVSIMAIIQDAPFKDFSDKQISLLVRDLDKGPVGQGLLKGLETAGSFRITTVPPAELEDDGAFEERIRKGEHQVGITIPVGSSERLEEGATLVLGELFAGLEEAPAIPTISDSVSVHLLVDPAVKHAFRALVRGTVQRVLAGLSSERLLMDLRSKMEDMTGAEMPPLKAPGPFIGIAQDMATAEISGSKVAFDSTQHNVPAWTVFAMFFTVVLLAGNMVGERRSGCMIRLLTMPGGTGERIAGRMIAYLLVGITQTALLLLVGVFLLPLFGLSALVLPGAIGLVHLAVAVVVIGTASTAYGVLVGSLSSTQQRSAVLGATTVVIFSAIGGIWVPLYIMPGPMRSLGSWSPLNWSMEAFNTVLLRNGDLLELMPALLPLLAFAAACVCVAIVMERLASSR
ncbi:MAG: ABC transporter permease [Flavobacteriales bacterium]|nr:ABC transporter permease [Flavobacteriales bacterium]